MAEMDRLGEMIGLKQFGKQFWRVGCGRKSQLPSISLPVPHSAQTIREFKGFKRKIRDFERRITRMKEFGTPEQVNKSIVRIGRWISFRFCLSFVMKNLWFSMQWYVRLDNVPKTAVWLFQSHQYHLEQAEFRVQQEYQVARESAMQRMKKVEDRLRMYYKQEHEWAKKSERRLQLYLSNNPWHPELLGREKGKEEKSLEPEKAKSAVPAIRVPHRRRKRREQTENKAVAASSIVTAERQWKFVLVDNALRPVIAPLSFTEKEVNLQRLTQVLTQALLLQECQLESTRVIKLLQYIMSLSMEDLRRWKEVSYAAPQGWKIFRTGRYRILVDFTEGDKEINCRFCIRDRKDAYVH
jgi:hypothetical protein